VFWEGWNLKLHLRPLFLDSPQPKDYVACHYSSSGVWTINEREEILDTPVLCTVRPWVVDFTEIRPTLCLTHEHYCSKALGHQGLYLAHKVAKYIREFLECFSDL
jgi:hypothetical protein